MGEHCIVPVDGITGLSHALDMHVVLRRSSSPSARTLVLIHGWPGSFVEFHRIAPLLHDFHLIVPSLPGFAFSGAPQRAGPSTSPLTLTSCASAVDAVVRALGFSGRYFVQGGCASLTAD